MTSEMDSRIPHVLNVLGVDITVDLVIHYTVNINMGRHVVI